MIRDDHNLSARLLNDLERQNRAHPESLARLSSGLVVTGLDPRPADRSLAEGLEFKLRSLSAAKQNINDGVSLLQTAERGFHEISAMIDRMQEINIAGTSATISDHERRFLFIEYQALHQEIDRIAATTESNGIPLFEGQNERTPERMILRIGDPTATRDGGSINEISFDNLTKVMASALSLGLKPVAGLLDEDRDLTVADANDLMAPDTSRFSSSYDQALDKIASFRAEYGAIQTRLERARAFNDVSFENIAAAKSKISDTDYASEVSRLTQNKILMQTTTALLTQNDLAARLGVSRVNSLLS